MRHLNAICMLLTLVCLGSVASGQIVIPPDVLKKKAESDEKVRPKRPTSRKSTTRPSGAKPGFQRMVIDFRRAAGDPVKRKAAADKLLKLGPRGAKILYSIVRSDLSGRTTSYKKAFYSKARSIGRGKYRAAGESQIKKWREQFRSTGSITKGSLKSKAGPAMDALLGALVPKREELLEDSDSLTSMRQEILALDSVLTRCAAVLKLESADSKLSDKLKQQETLLSLMGAPMSDAHRKTVEEPLKQFGKMQFEEWHGVVHLNVIRTLLGLSPMQIDLKLSAAGRDHSKDMSEHKFFSHKSPVEGKSTPWDRAARQGTKSNGECIAAGVSSGPHAIRMWFFSPGHHKIIMSGASRVGLGTHNRKWTLMTG